MSILEQLREKSKKVKFEDKEAISYLVQEYDLALENALLKLNNRAVQIKDLKHRWNKQICFCSPHWTKEEKERHFCDVCLKLIPLE